MNGNAKKYSAWDAFGLFGLNSKILLMRKMQYRADFAMGVVVAIGFSALGPLAQFLLYSKSNGYPGWTWDQMLLFQATLLLMGGICDVLFGTLRENIDALMEKGEFDRLLLRPYPPLMLLLTGGFKPYGLGSVLVGVGALVYAGARLGFPGGLSGMSLFLLFAIARILLQISINVLYCFFSVRWVYTMRLGEIMDKVMSYGNYPMEIFPRAIRIVFETFLPFAIACYWPAKALLGPLGWMAAASLAGTVLFLFFTLALWRGQLKSYVSAGG
jgi:ABC-2 type transport system permease protein